MTRSALFSLESRWSSAAVSGRGPAMISLALIMLIGSAEGLQAEDWPWFLGPRHTGESSETQLNLDWTKAEPPTAWKQPVGTGYSAPSVLGERLVVHHRMGEEEIISCRSVNNGSEIWKYAYPSTFQDPYGYNNGPRCSPVLTTDRCYALGAEGMLVCVTMADGKLVWEKDLRKEFSLPEWFFGVGCSPILDGNRLIVLVGGQPNSGVVAFDIADGKVLWQAVGKDTWDGTQTDEGETYKWLGDEMVVSYSSPVIAEIHGKRHLLCLMRQGLVSLDPENGDQNFSYWFRARVHESVNAARPLVIDDQIFLSAAYQVGSALLKVGEDGKSYTEVWRDKKNLQTHWSTPIYVDGCIYGFTGRHENEGELRCIQLSDGKVLWSSTGFNGDLSELARDRTTGNIVEAKTGKVIPYPFFGRGSKIKAGNKFIVLGERGTIAVVDVDKEKFVERGRFFLSEIDYPAWAAPVLSNGQMYLRSEKWLVRIDLTVKQ